MARPLVEGRGGAAAGLALAATGLAADAGEAAGLAAAAGLTAGATVAAGFGALVGALVGDAGADGWQAARSVAAIGSPSAVRRWSAARRPIRLASQGFAARDG